MSHWGSLYSATRESADAISAFLHSKDIYYERSGCFEGYHFSISSQIDMINDFIDTLL